jgi:hypothetical protein
MRVSEGICGVRQSDRLTKDTRVRGIVDNVSVPDYPRVVQVDNEDVQAS